jgi:hypothetical protein
MATMPVVCLYGAAACDRHTKLDMPLQLPCNMWCPPTCCMWMTGAPMSRTSSEQLPPSSSIRAVHRVMSPLTPALMLLRSRPRREVLVLWGGRKWVVAADGVHRVISSVHRCEVVCYWYPSGYTGEEASAPGSMTTPVMWGLKQCTAPPSSPQGSFPSSTSYCLQQLSEHLGIQRVGKQVRTLPLSFSAEHLSLTPHT